MTTDNLISLDADSFGELRNFDIRVYLTAFPGDEGDEEYTLVETDECCSLANLRDACYGHLNNLPLSAVCEARFQAGDPVFTKGDSGVIRVSLSWVAHQPHVRWRPTEADSWALYNVEQVLECGAVLISRHMLMAAQPPKRLMVHASELRPVETVAICGKGVCEGISSNGIAGRTITADRDILQEGGPDAVETAFVLARARLL